MARNVEIKARVTDLSEVRRRLGTLRWRGESHLRQTDTFFRVGRGRLKLREFDDGTGELIFYERSDSESAKLSQYDRIPCQDPRAMLQALSTALGVRGVVRKQRHVILIDNTRVHLDEVDGLGSFIELEVVLDESEAASTGERVVAELLATLQIPAAHLVRGAYIDLLEERELRA